jgi:hypothetical protein
MTDQTHIYRAKEAMRKAAARAVDATNADQAAAASARRALDVERAALKAAHPSADEIQGVAKEVCRRAQLASDLARRARKAAREAAVQATETTDWADSLSVQRACADSAERAATEAGDHANNARRLARWSAQQVADVCALSGPPRRTELGTDWSAA